MSSFTAREIDQMNFARSYGVGFEVPFLDLNGENAVRPTGGIIHRCGRNSFDVVAHHQKVDGSLF